MYIRKFKNFTESISGTELMGSMGPNYGQQVLPNSITSSDTQVIMSDVDGNLYTKDDYDNFYQDYLKNNGKPLNNSEFNRENLTEVMAFLSQINEASVDEVKSFILDFGYFLSLNLAHIRQQSKDESSSKELSNMVSNFNNPIINGKNFFEIVGDVNGIIKNPKMLFGLLSKIREYLIYIEPRIEKFVKDGEKKTIWLGKISKFKDRYRSIIT